MLIAVVAGMDMDTLSEAAAALHTATVDSLRSEKYFSVSETSAPKEVTGGAGGHRYRDETAHFIRWALAAELPAAIQARTLGINIKSRRRLATRRRRQLDHLRRQH